MSHVRCTPSSHKQRHLAEDIRRRLIDQLSTGRVPEAGQTAGGTVLS
jgi:hypothetical protein